MNTMFAQRNSAARVATAMVAMVSIVASLVTPVFLQTARADYGDDYGSYYTDYGYYDTGYASYDSYDYYADDGYGSYYYDDYTSVPSYSYDSGYDDTYNAYYEDSYDYGYSYNNSSYDPYADYYAGYNSAYSSYNYQPYHSISSTYYNTNTGCSYSGCTNTCTSKCCTENCGNTQVNPPQLTTQSATTVGEVSATLNCSVNPNGSSTSARFEWGTSSSFGHTTSSQTYTSVGTMQQYISGLTANTTYYYRCTGSNAGGSATGSTLSFRTSEVYDPMMAMSVSTQSPTNISTSGATFQCALNNTGTLPTDVWFEYGTSQYNLYQTTSHDTYSSARTVQKVVPGLSPDTMYYYRCMGQNTKSVDKGSVVSFRTNKTYVPPAQNAPTLTTQSATNIRQTYATLNCSVNPNGSTTSARFEWGTTQSLGHTTSSQSHYSSATMSQDVPGLIANTTYYYRCSGENAGGSATGSILSFRTGQAYTGSAPSVTTKSVSNVSETSAVFRCSLDDTGDLATDVWFEYGTSQNNLYQTTSHDTYSSSRIVEKTVSRLSSNTTYYYRCVGQNAKGVDEGSVVSFRTDDNGWNNGSAPIVNTLSASNITYSSANVACSIDPNGATSDVWVEYGDSTSMSQSTSRQSYSSSTTTSQYLSGLQSGRTYYYRCAAQNSYGTTYGSRLSFVTINQQHYVDQRPYASTNQATNVTSSSATLNGYVSYQGDGSVDRWFEYGPTMSLEYTTNRQSQGYSSGNVTESVYNLRDNTTYYYRVAASNSAGTTYGNILSFRTSDGGWTLNQAPIATTGAAVNVARTSARFTGTASIPTVAYTTAWFEWGTDQSLGRTTATQSVGSATSAVNQSMFGLNYATTYYYRLVVQNTYGISRGNIVSFTTLGAPPEAPMQSVTPTVVKEYGTHITKSVENLDYQNGSSTDVFAERGQMVRFIIRVENTGDYVIPEATIRDLVPYYLEFANSDDNVRYDGTRREVVWYIGDLAVGESREVTLDMKVTDDARIGSTIENIARLESPKHNEVSNTIYVRITDNIEVDAHVSRAGTGAAALFFGDGGFFPTTLLGWLILLILILIIAVIGHYVVTKYNESHAKKIAAKAARETQEAQRQQMMYNQMYAMQTPSTTGDVGQRQSQASYPYPPHYEQPYRGQQMPPQNDQNRQVQ